MGSGNKKTQFSIVVLLIMSMVFSACSSNNGDDPDDIIVATESISIAHIGTPTTVSPTAKILDTPNPDTTVDSQLAEEKKMPEPPVSPSPTRQAVARPHLAGWLGEPSSSDRVRVSSTCDDQPILIGGRGTAPSPSSPSGSTSLQTGQIGDPDQHLSNLAGMATAIFQMVDSRLDETTQLTEIVSAVEYETVWLANLCHSLGLLDLFANDSSSSSTVQTLLRSRADILTNNATELRESQTLSAASKSIRYEHTSRFSELLEKIIRTGEIDGTLVSFEQASIKIPYSHGWLLTRNNGKFQMSSPPEFQFGGIPGLGPKGWDRGTGVNVFTTTHADSWNLDNLADIAPLLFRKYGDLIEQSIASSQDSTQLEYLSESNGWRTFISATIRGNTSIFIEVGCPTTLGAHCDEIAERVFANAIFS